MDTHQDNQYQVDDLNDPFFESASFLPSDCCSDEESFSNSDNQIIPQQDEQFPITMKAILYHQEELSEFDPISDTNSNLESKQEHSNIELPKGVLHKSIKKIPKVPSTKSKSTKNTLFALWNSQKSQTLIDKFIENEGFWPVIQEEFEGGVYPEKFLQVKLTQILRTEKVPRIQEVIEVKKQNIQDKINEANFITTQHPLLKKLPLLPSHDEDSATFFKFFEQSNGLSKEQVDNWVQDQIIKKRQTSQEASTQSVARECLQQLQIMKALVLNVFTEINKIQREELIKLEEIAKVQGISLNFGQ